MLDEMYLKIVFILANNADPDEMPLSCGISSGSSLFAKSRIKDYYKAINLLKNNCFQNNVAIEKQFTLENGLG